MLRLQKGICILFCVFCIRPASYGFTLKDFFYPSWSPSSGTTITYDTRKEIYQIRPQSREHLFFKKGISPKSLSARYDTGTLIINAGYFGRDANGYFPAGHFNADSTLIDTSRCERDPNLCGYVDLEKLTISENNRTAPGPMMGVGPLMMLDGIVNKKIQNKTSHWTKKTQRTILINTNEGPIFLVTKRKYALDRMLAYAVKHFGRKISVINLDGGSSTSLRTSNTEYQYNSKKVLPTFFVLK